MSITGERPEWFDQAACQSYAERMGGPARDRIFFPARGETTTKARQICAECPVSDQCLEWALVTGQKYGVWAGTSERQRRVLRRERGLNVGGRPLTPIDHGTQAGYAAHLRRLETACDPCREAHRAYVAEYDRLRSVS